MPKKELNETFRQNRRLNDIKLGLADYEGKLLLSRYLDEIKIITGYVKSQYLDIAIDVADSRNNEVHQKVFDPNGILESGENVCLKERGLPACMFASEAEANEISLIFSNVKVFSTFQLCRRLAARVPSPILL